MYRRLLDLSKGQKGIFSRDYLMAKLIWSESYLLETIADFHKGKNEFKMTGFRLPFSGSYRDTCLISLPCAFYKKTKEVDSDQIWSEVQSEAEKEILQQGFFYRFFHAEEKLNQILRSYSEKSRNAVLYDASGSELAISSDEEFTAGTKLFGPVILYYRELDIVSLLFHQGSDFNDPQREQQKSKLETLVNQFLPQPG